MTSESPEVLDFSLLSLVKDTGNFEGGFGFQNHSIPFYYEHFLLSRKFLKTRCQVLSSAN